MKSMMIHSRILNPVKIALTYIQESSDSYSYPSEFDAIVVEKLVETVEKEINTYCEENGVKTRFDFIPYPVVYRRQHEHPGLPEVRQMASYWLSATTLVCSSMEHTTIST